MGRASSLLPAHQGDVAGLLLAEPVLRGVEAKVLLGPRQGQQGRQVPERVPRAAGGRCGGVTVLLLWGAGKGGRLAEQDKLCRLYMVGQGSSIRVLLLIGYGCSH